MALRNNPDLVPLPTLARLLRLPAAWLRDEAKAGRIPALRAGRKWLFNSTAVQRVLARRAAEGGVEPGSDPKGASR